MIGFYRLAVVHKYFTISIFNSLQQTKLYCNGFIFKTWHIHTELSCLKRDWRWMQMQSVYLKHKNEAHMRTVK